MMTTRKNKSTEGQVAASAAAEPSEQGDTADGVLRYVHYQPAAMILAYRRKIEASGLDDARRAQYLKELEEGFKGYTYHEK